MDPQSRNASTILAWLASRSKGVVSRTELLAAGFSPTQIKARVRNGGLIREFPGVYRVGHRAPNAEARYLAAVKACGKGALLSGRAAAWLWGLIKGSPPPPEVSAPTERRVEGIRTRHRRMHRSEMTRRNGIPITSVPLTLLDLSPLLAPFELARACHEAGVRYRTTPRMVEAALERRPNAKGAAELRAVLSGEEPLLLSRLEERFLALLRAHDLPLPQTNKRNDGHYVDCRRPEHRLTVELDSYRFHNSRHAWEADRKREREAYARGDEFRRFTWGDVTESTAATLAELEPLLAAR